MPPARFDLHLHTEFSFDCDTPLAGIEAHCLAKGLTGIAVTDHDTIEGALRLRDRVKALRIIIGEEITTRDGDVVGLFLRERVAPKRSARETIAAIHAQGGLAYLPHPFDRQRARKTGGASLAETIESVDIVETFNGKVGREQYNTLAADYALKQRKIAGGGSDAHSLRAIGTVTNEIELPEGYDYTDAQIFLTAMRKARIVGRRRSPVGGWLVAGRRPLTLALRRLRGIPK